MKLIKMRNEDTDLKELLKAEYNNIQIIKKEIEQT